MNTILTKSPCSLLAIFLCSLISITHAQKPSPASKIPKKTILKIPLTKEELSKASLHDLKKTFDLKKALARPSIKTDTIKQLTNHLNTNKNNNLLLTLTNKQLKQSYKIKLNQNLQNNHFDLGSHNLIDKLLDKNWDKHTYGPLDWSLEGVIPLINNLIAKYHACTECRLQIQNKPTSSLCSKCLQKKPPKFFLVKEYAQAYFNDIKQGVCCVLLDDSSIEKDGDSLILNTVPYSSLYPKLDNKITDNMRVVKNCGTGFLVRKTWVLTARHNLEDKPASDLHFAFGYYPESGPREVEIIRGSKVIKKGAGLYSEDPTQDWVIIELERAPTDAYVLPLGKLSAPITGKPVFMLGHPRGLPLLTAIKGFVYQKDVYTKLTLCNLDSFSGNSGSPVFSLNSLEVVGLMVKGQSDTITEDGVEVNVSSSELLKDSGEGFIELDEVIEFLKNAQ